MYRWRSVICAQETAFYTSLTPGLQASRTRRWPAAGP